MNCNISPIAFYPSRAAQIWRSGYYQRNIAVVTGVDLPAFIINNAPAEKPSTVEIYDPNTDQLVATRSCDDILSHTSTVDGVSVNSWIYQATSSGIFGYNVPGYYYLKIGNYYSDIIKFGAINGDYVKLTYQFFDDIITADGTLISKYIVYQQIFETILWHPTYETTEEGKENNGIFYAMQQTLKKMCGFTEIVNTAQLDVLNLTRMADNVQIEARSNGVIRNFTTNTFEITDKWESDEVASIQVQFDLFNIVRKYQKSNVAPEPLPVPTPPPPPANYYIRGTAQQGVNMVQFEINGVNTNVPVYNGQWEYAYDTPLELFRTAVGDIWPYRQMTNVDKITSIDLSQSCMFAQADHVRLCRLTNCTSINFAECTFAMQRNLSYCFAGNPKLTTITMAEATFANMTQGEGVFYEDSLLETVTMPKALLTKGAFAMFGLCEKLKTVNLPLATFANETSCGKMFTGCKNLQTINMPVATFANVTTMRYMFENAKGFYDEDVEEYEFDFGSLFPACTASPTDVQGMFEGSTFQTIDVTDLDMSACTNAASMYADSAVREATMTAAQFAAMTDISRMFKNCYIRTSTLNVLATVTFANVTNADSMFEGSKQIGTATLDLAAATFANATSVEAMFKNTDFSQISLSVATFASVTNAQSMYYGCKATVIDMPSATFGNVTGATNMFLSCANLITVNVPSSSTWEMNISFAQSENLSIATLTALSKWCADMTAYTPARTLTFNANARSRWQLPATIAQYNMAVATLGTKNWTIQ